MKRFTFMLLTALFAVAAMADGSQKRLPAGQATPFLTQMQLGQRANVKQAPRELAGRIQSSRARSPRKAVAAADLVGDYTWSYQTASETSTDLESLETTEGSSRVSIALSTTTEGGITLSGMFPNDMEASLESDENGDYFVIEAGQLAGTSSYGDYVLYGMFYYEGDEENEEGWYYGDIYGYIQEDGSIAIYPWLCRVLSGGDYDGYSLTPYWVEGSTLTLADPLSVVVAPEGLETEEYVVVARNYKDDEDVSGSVYIGFDGSDVYIQGLSSWLPEAWVKGTLEGTTITFPYGQYLGNYGGNYDMFLNVLMGEDVVFEYDAEAGTLTAQNEFFLLDNSQYYFDSYRGAVFKKVVEKAAMPANPAITSLQNGNYGWYFGFNIPTVDVDGNGLATAKLYYMIYTDVEGEIAPLTFTSATHERLTEDMTEIPYGFTEEWDFYSSSIYLNDLFSDDWNNLGIQSIYYGGGEVNATEVQWYHIKDYSGPKEVTFNFNTMDVPTSNNASTDGDIPDATDFIEDVVTLTVSAKDESSNTPNRFWGTSNGPQLRVYSGTLTFTVPEGATITSIVFNYGKWNDENAADSGEMSNDASEKAATWTGEAQAVVVTIAGNTQLNSITVTYTSEGGTEEPDELVVLPDGVEPVEYTLVASGATSQGGISIEETMYVAFDGTDVYLQGLAYYFPEAFVKGTLTEENQVIVPGGQFVGEDEYGVEYLVALGVDDEGYFTDEENIVFNYDPEAGTLTLQGYYGESGTKDKSALWDYFTSAVYTPGGLVLPDPVVLPEGVEAETWYIVANTYSSGKLKGEEIGVAVDGNDIYLQGLCEYLPEAWVKGTIEDGKASFPGGQFYGTYVQEYEGEEYSYNLFFGGYGYDEETDDTYFSDVVFDYDAEAGTLMTGDYILLNASQSVISFYDYYNNVSITREQPEFPDPIEAPEDLVTEPYIFTGFNTYFEEDMTPYQVQVGFYGEDEVYIQGLSTYIEEAWVKGTLENGVLTIPETYLGEYEGWGTVDLYFPETEFIYDAEAGKFTSEEGFSTYDDDGYAYDEVSNVVLTKIVEKAATPADPSVKNFILIGVDDDNNTTDADGNPIFATYPWVGFDIPVVDVDGAPMLQDKLSYVVYIVDKDGIQKELTLTTDLYTRLEEDMTEIPYAFSDNYDIYAGGNPLYLNQDPKEIITWKKIGVQSIYRGLGEENRSNIGWFDIVEYLHENDISTGINDINSSMADDKSIYNLAGQRVQKAQKGLYIVNGKKVAVK